jgi:hypothetical protein
MKKHDALENKGGKDLAVSKWAKFGISHCERFQINKEGIETCSEKISLNQHKSASSSANSGDNSNDYFLKSS